MHEWISQRSKGLLLILGPTLVGVIGWGHYWVGPEVATSIFYVLPIFMMAWWVGNRAGVTIALLSAATWLLADLLSGHVYTNPIVPYWNFIAKFGLFLFLALTLRKLRMAFDHEKDYARKDSLTGIANSRAFLEMANVELNRARRYQTTLAVAYIDIDNFKRINDRYGHGIGDSVICAVAHTLRKRVRAIDVVARLGGDEFAILISDTSSESIRLLLQELHKDLGVTMEKIGWPITLSVGVAIFIVPPVDVEIMIKRADTLMYAVKNDGKNTLRYEIFDATKKAEEGYITPAVLTKMGTE